MWFEKFYSQINLSFKFQFPKDFAEFPYNVVQVRAKFAERSLGHLEVIGCWRLTAAF